MKRTRVATKTVTYLTWIFCMAVGGFVVPSTRAQTGSGETSSKTAAPAEPDIPAANPARPTVTNPATIPPVGYLQFEQGIFQANDSPQLDRQFSVNQTTKIAVASRLMVEFFSQPFAATKLSTGTSHDTGDLDLGVQAIAIPGKGSFPTIAAGYIGRVRSGTAPDLDIGSFSQSALILISGDAKGFHYDTNFIVSEQKSPPIRRAQFGQTISITHPIFSKARNLTMTGELWHFTQPFVPASATQPGGNAVGTLWAVAWSPRPNLVFDAGIDHGLTSTSTQWEGVAGFTYLLPKRLWKK
ncbi:MAG TPA: hypothetical protein VGD64_11800 [Acidisarcina sp.]